MPSPARPERTLGQAALELDGDVAAGHRKVGRVEHMVAAALTAAVTQGVVDADLDQGAAALAVSLARAVDMGSRDPYAVAAAGRELSALLARLRLDPESRASENGVGDQVQEWLDRVTKPA